MLLNQAMRYCKINYMCLIKIPQKHAIKNVLNTVPQQLKSTMYPGADPGSFLGGGALVSCSASTPIIHIVFFLQNTSCIRKPQVISGRGGVHTPCTLPLDPPLISVPFQTNRTFKKPNPLACAYLHGLIPSVL